MAVGGREISVPICDGTLTLRGRVWGNEDAPSDKRILAWPGWLDNSGSWFTSAPFYEEKGYLFVAMDPPGCGISDHKSLSAFYNDFEECHHIITVADFLGWTEPFILMGHSRGSNISSTVAGVFRERLCALILMETSMCMSGGYFMNYEHTHPNDDGPLSGGLRGLVLDRAKRLSRPPKKFRSFEEAVIHNNNHPMFPKAMITSRNIAMRHISPIYGPKEEKDKEFNFVFTHDTKTYGQGQPVPIFPNANLALKKGILCPVLIVNMEGALWSSSSDVDEFLATLKKRDFMLGNEEVAVQCFLDWKRRVTSVPDLTMKLVPGKHHVHSDNAELCTAIVMDFLDQRIHFPTKALQQLSSSAQGFVEAPIFRDFRGDCFSEYKHVFLLPDDDTKEEPQIQNILREELIVESFGIPIGAVLHGNKASENRFVCVSDCQDNAASFEFFAQHLINEIPNSSVVAFDRPGRGKTAALALDRFYSKAEDAMLALDVADAVGFENFTLVCHARSAAIGVLLGRWFPERIKSLIFLSAFGETDEPLAIPNEWLGSEIYYSFLEEKQQIEPSIPLKKFYRSEQSEKLFQDREKAAETKQDRRLQNRPPVDITEESLERNIPRISCPVMILNPHNKQTRIMHQILKANNSESAKYLSRTRNEAAMFTGALVEVEKIAGSRYVHVDNVAAVVSSVKGFLARNGITSQASNAAERETKQNRASL